MSLDSLQFKRLTGNWNNYKNTVLGSGEPLLVTESVTNFTVTNKYCTPPFFVLGDGKSTLEKLVSDGNFYVNKNTITTLIDDISPLGSTQDSVGIVVEDPDQHCGGTSKRFARYDHTHSLSKYVAEQTLGCNERTDYYSCRRIKAGTTDPLTSNVPGEIGDIYIKLDSNGGK